MTGLGAPNPGRRNRLFATLAWLVLGCLSCFGPPGAHAQESPTLEQLLDGLMSDDAEVHRQVLDDIVALGPNAAAELEAVALDVRRPVRVRSGAVFALGRIRAPSSADVLAQLWAGGLDSLGSALAIQVAVALAELGELDPLRDMLSSGDEVLSAKAAVQLGLRQDEASVDALRAAYESDSLARMRPFFAIALGLLGDDRGHDILRSGLRTPELRNHSAVALSHCGHLDGLRFDLEFALADVDPLVRLRALEGLITLEPSNLDETLQGALEDPDPRVRETAEDSQRGRPRRPRRGP